MTLDWTRGELRKGLRGFDSGAFFEAHKHWESMWLAACDSKKTFLQALIQMVASFHHFERGNHKVPRSRFERSRFAADAFACRVSAAVRTR
jgi:predicted metal-dependent hydrolase